MTAVQKDHQRLLENLSRLQKLHTAKALSEIIGVDRSTWTRKMKEPWRTFSYDELRSISRYCKIDFVQLVDGEIKLR